MVRTAGLKKNGIRDMELNGQKMSKMTISMTMNRTHIIRKGVQLDSQGALPLPRI